VEFTFSFNINPEHLIYAMGAITAILGGKFVIPAIRRNNNQPTTKK